MKGIRTITTDNKNGLTTYADWDLAIIGQPLDVRGTQAIAFATESSKKLIKLIYDPDNGGSFKLDGTTAPMLHIETVILSANSVLIESTTLGVVEILRILRTLYTRERKNVDILYVEPMEYAQAPENGVLTSRQYKLSGNRRFEGVKGFALELSMHETGRVIFFLGYEGARLSQALEQLSIQSWCKTAVFGVPGFAPGWETNSFANNVEQISASKFKGVRFCSASSVLDAYRTLCEVHTSTHDPDRPTVIVPLGTKPHSIATALFLCSHASFQQSSLIYDHPAREEKRSREVRKWHLYKVTLHAP